MIALDDAEIKYSTVQNWYPGDSDGKGGIKSDVSFSSSWKLTAEIRVELPFSGNYIATGVDVLVDSHTSKEFNFNYDTQKGEFKSYDQKPTLPAAKSPT